MPKIQHVGDNRYRFLCPACWHTHTFRSNGPEPEQEAYTWGFDGNYERPTITPSVKVTLGPPDCPASWMGADGQMYYLCCHSVITGGLIYFAGDSTHPMAGQTVELPEIDGYG